VQTHLILEMAADSVGERIALGGLHGGLSYGELARRAKAAAGWLHAQAGEKLVFIGLNGESLPAAFFASSFAGKPFSPLNYRLSDADLRRLLERTAPSVAVVDDDMMSRVAGVAGVTLVPMSAFDAICADPANTEGLPAEVDQHIAVLLFTSGTTGDPKVAVLRHRHLTSYVFSTVEFCSAEEDEAALVSVPPYHIAGISAIMTNMFATRRMVYLANFTPEAWVDVVEHEAVSHAMVVPTMLGRVLDVLQSRQEVLPALKALSYGGGRMPQPVIERALTWMPHVGFVNAYGLTETSSTIAVLNADDHREAVISDDPKVRRRLASVGQSLPSLEIEIRDEAGNSLPWGVTGEVHVRGDQIAGEYLHRKAIDHEGWFATNDGGWLDEDGYLYVEGRLDDVIVRGGENISPGEIEDVLREHERVKDVAVLGAPDEQWGEKIVAFVVAAAPAPSAEALAAFVRAKLRSTKTPEVWLFRDELPYNETGKLLRRVLKAELIDGSGPNG